SSCLYDVDLKHGARTPQGTGRQSWSAYRECARSSQSNSLGRPAFLPCASIAASPPGRGAGLARARPLWSHFTCIRCAPSRAIQGDRPRGTGLADILKPDICVIGGGAGGLAAVETARAADASVVLVAPDLLDDSGAIAGRALGAVAARADLLRHSESLGFPAF